MKIAWGIGRRLLDMRLSHQLRAAFVVLIVITGVVCAVALVGLMRVGDANDALANRWLPSLGKLSDARVAILNSREFEVKHGRATDASYYAEYEEKINEDNKQVVALLNAVVSDAGNAELIGKLKKAWQEYEQAQKKVIALGRGKKQQDAADVSDGLAATAFDTTTGALDALAKQTFASGKLAGEAAEAVLGQTRFTLVGLFMGALAIGLTLAFAINRVVKTQLGCEPKEAAAAVQAMAAGDLSVHISVAVGREDSLMGRIKEMQTGLTTVVQRVRHNADSVAVASQEIASGNLDLSQRTEQQAASLQHTASSMEQLGATVRQNSDSASQGNRLAVKASTIAATGGKLVAEVVQTMRGINESSKKIADIIGVIDGIAFQTNILALNAAVEAARAGEQGRGFAVVASEVRNLARRSAEAAKEIKSLINASVERVEQGSALVDKSGATMQEIVAAIARVTDIMGEISHASIEQSSGVSQVGGSIAQMDEATQHNAALVEQTSAAAESLKLQAQALVSAVAVFKLGGQTSQALGLAR